MTVRLQELWVCGLAIVLGCGARSLSGDSGSSGEPDGTGGDGGQVPSDTSGTGATASSPSTSTSTSSSPDTPTSSADETTWSDSTTSLDTSPIPGIWEGIVRFGAWHTYMTACGFGDVCFPWVGCENLYVRAEGTMRWVNGGIDGCNGWSLDIEELLEARACKPTDCEAGCPGPISCSAQCDASLQDCPNPDEKCAIDASLGSPGVHLRRCVPLPPVPVAEGGACTVAATTDEGYDDCDRGLHCWAEEPTATTGVCVPFCLPNYPPSCATNCVQCVFGSEGLCLSDCQGCDLFHSC